MVDERPMSEQQFEELEQKEQKEFDGVKTRIYIAGPFRFRAQLAALRDTLCAGFGPQLEVTAGWLADPDDQQSPVIMRPDFAERAKAMAARDMRQTSSAHAVVSFNPPGWEDKGSGGRHVETGIALTLGKPVFLLGVPSNVFHRAAGVLVCPTEADLINALGAWIDSRQAQAPQG